MCSPRRHKCKSQAEVQGSGWRARVQGKPPAVAGDYRAIEEASYGLRVGMAGAAGGQQGLDSSQAW